MEGKHSHNEAVMGDEGFTPGDAYPNCEGEPCANMADIDEVPGDNSADAEATETAEWKDKYVRLQAEFDNYRKRTLREKLELAALGGEDVMRALLPVLDDVDRALEAMQKTDDVASVRMGIELVSKKLRDVLGAKGLSEIDAVGSVLDTDLHDAVAQVAGDKKTRGKVVEVVQKGYKLKDKVVRHAKCVVGE
ncbi:MAG: nucleotide exchange factor GrpE [Rikenellaceae bacterium]|nr:nucleotide exchange factor GrpE [Rikenellaceae bacterium]MCL2692871.1 nucleotide exchange factor GrpE [Rikenellaceae bacterium]